ncbi:MAG: 4-(cytidine 5'-diphospho)-2-C-methyl-D-erythritol kinase [Rhodospirillaceae bacterium]
MALTEVSAVPEPMKIQAAAKVNLTLHITGKRNDGLHLLESLVGFTSITDQITLTEASATSVTVFGPEAETLLNEKYNLAERAADLAREQTKSLKGVRISLEKNIPVAAGMGGGSADAAAVLRGCLRMWGETEIYDLNNRSLVELLGADIPACRYGRAAWVSGVGELIKPAPQFPTLWMVLVNPRIPISTSAVFRSFAGRLRKAEFIDDAGPAWPISTSDFIDYLAERENSLSEVAMSIAPIISAVIQVLQEAPHCLMARMTGTGPTCFGLFATEQKAKNAAQIIANAEPDWWVRPTLLLSSAST